jgi:subtilase family serine protease
MATTSTRRPRALGALVAVTPIVLLASFVIAATAAGPVAEAQATCTDPSDVSGFTPQQLARRYGIDELVARGSDGTGVTVVILEEGESIDLDVLAEWEACMGVDGPEVTQTLVGGGSMPAVGHEAQGDVEVVAGLLPGASVHVLVTNGGLADLLEAALDPTHTGGEPADVLSLSYGRCESAAASERDAVDARLERIAERGVWFLKSAGDSGSDDCAPHKQCPPYAGAEAAVEYPTSHPSVTGVGGTQIDDGHTTGPATVWNSAHPGDCGGGGGGRSTLFDLPAFQQGFAPPGETSRMVPDISGLSGHPKYQILFPSGWETDGGTSFATPLYAAGLAAVRSDLARRGIPIPPDLNTVLYRAASDPATYAAVFTDVTETDNDLLGVGCCTAGPGYDMASGLGELDLAAFADWLASTSSTTTTTTTTGGGTDSAGVVVVPAFTG